MRSGIKDQVPTIAGRRIYSIPSLVCAAVLMFILLFLIALMVGLTVNGSLRWGWGPEHPAPPHEHLNPAQA